MHDSALIQKGGCRSHVLLYLAPFILIEESVTSDDFDILSYGGHIGPGI